jgi:DNA-binding NarL/FixJ family response regulator
LARYYDFLPPQKSRVTSEQQTCPQFLPINSHFGQWISIDLHGQESYLCERAQKLAANLKIAAKREREHNLCQINLLVYPSASQNGPMTQLRGPNDIKVLIAHHSPLACYGLRQLFNSMNAIVVAEAADAHTTWLRAQHNPANLLMLEFELPGDAWTLLRQLLISKPSVRTILFATAITPKQIRKALGLGIRGVLTADAPPELILKSARTVASGQLWLQREQISRVLLSQGKKLEHSIESDNGSPKYALTARELQLVALISRGYRNRDMALQLNLSEQTVKHHLNHIFDKLSVTSRLQLAAYAFNHPMPLPPGKTDA